MYEEPDNGSELNIIMTFFEINTGIILIFKNTLRFL